MTEQHYIITWEGYPVMSLSSMADAQEMILTITQENAYNDFCSRTFFCDETPEQYVDYQNFDRVNEANKWWDAGKPRTSTWYGYTLMKSVESYGINAVIHLN